eukprot:551911-Alexandrium_andersonii.AAC.1
MSRKASHRQPGCCVPHGQRAALRGKQLRGAQRGTACPVAPSTRQGGNDTAGATANRPPGNTM